MTLRREIVVVGAGAIGRGFLPWLFEPEAFDFVFVDRDPAIVEGMRRTGWATTHRVRNGRLEARRVPVAEACFPDERPLVRHRDPAAIFLAVGPRHAVDAARAVEGARCPVIVCENDPASVERIRGELDLPGAFFAVPDVITSNTAPPDLLGEDPLAVVTEDGVLFVDDRAAGAGLGGEIRFLPIETLLGEQWTAKLYLHNTPHCIAAYLGALVGARFVHEAMADPEVGQIVDGAMREMLDSLKLQWEIPHEFLEWYAGKELARFRQPLLFDPIARVAREPLRKLEREGRLIGAAQVCVALGFIPQNVLTGIAAALLFDDPKDADRQLAFLRRALPASALLTHILALRKGEALEVALESRLPAIIERLELLGRRGGRPR